MLVLSRGGRGEYEVMLKETQHPGQVVAHPCRCSLVALRRLGGAGILFLRHSIAEMNSACEPLQRNVTARLVALIADVIFLQCPRLTAFNIEKLLRCRYVRRYSNLPLGHHQ